MRPDGARGHPRPPDHHASSNEVCEARSMPFLVPAGDAAAAENPALIAETSPDHFVPRLALRHWAGPGRRVDRTLREGDEIAVFRGLGSAGPLARTGRLLARVGPRPHRRRRAQQHESSAPVFPASTSRGGSSPPTPWRTAGPPASSFIWSRDSSSSATEGPFAIRGGSRSSSGGSRAEATTRGRGGPRPTIEGLWPQPL
jgi:hypothetical protein